MKLDGHSWLVHQSMLLAECLIYPFYTVARKGRRRVFVCVQFLCCTCMCVCDVIMVTIWTQSHWSRIKCRHFTQKWLVLCRWMEFLLHSEHLVPAPRLPISIEWHSFVNSSLRALQPTKSRNMPFHCQHRLSARPPGLFWLSVKQDYPRGHHVLLTRRPSSHHNAKPTDQSPEGSI